MKEREWPQLETAAGSHVGEVRKNNEDRFAIAALPCDRGPSTLALVADGVGGHAAGELAAQIAVEEMLRDLNTGPCADPLRALPRAVVRAGRAVRSRARRDEALRGMATTIAAAWVVGRRLYTATVGDSRIYLMRGGRLRQASIDHTWVEEAMERGVLTREQARFHPNAHVLRRHLGSDQDPEPDLRLRVGEGNTASAANQGLELEDGDAVVLCSDGLSDLVDEEEIGYALRHKRLEQTVKELIDLARRRGGHDNVTVAILRMPGRRAAPKGRLWLWRIAVWVLLLLAVAGTALLYLSRKAPGLF